MEGQKKIIIAIYFMPNTFVATDEYGYGFTLGISYFYKQKEGFV